MASGVPFYLIIIYEDYHDEWMNEEKNKYAHNITARNAREDDDATVLWIII